MTKDHDDTADTTEEQPPLTRHVPYCSGEGAIYSPEYLRRREGNAYGSAPEDWRAFAR